MQESSTNIHTNMTVQYISCHNGFEKLRHLSIFIPASRLNSFFDRSSKLLQNENTETLKSAQDAALCTEKSTGTRLLWNWLGPMARNSFPVLETILPFNLWPCAHLPLLTLYCRGDSLFLHSFMVWRWSVSVFLSQCVKTGLLCPIHKTFRNRKCADSKPVILFI